MPQKAVDGADDLHIGVHVDAAKAIQGVEANNVRDKGPFFCFIGLPDVERSGGNLIVFLRPGPDLIIRAIFFPACDALLRGRRQRLAAEPAIVDDLGNHNRFLLSSHHGQ